MDHEITGTLVSGNTYRVTPYLVDIRSATGTELKSADVHHLTGVGRDGTTVQVRHRDGDAFTLTTQTLDEAGRIEHLLRQSVPSVPFRATPPTAGTSRRSWIIIGSVVAAVLLVGAIGAFGGGLPSDEVEVVYRVTDSEGDTVDLTFENGGGNSQQISEAETTWRRTYTMERGDFVYVSAQRNGGSGTVRCTISVDGEVIEEAQSSGPHVIATCSGSAR